MKFLLISAIFGVSFACSLTVCPSGFSLVNGNKCLKYFPQQLGHSEAEVDCTGYGGTLALPKNAIDNRAIAQFASDNGAPNIWLGLFCFANQNASSCYYDDQSGTTATYSNFLGGYPIVDGIYEGCVYMPTNSGKWISAKCDTPNLPFVCEVPTTKEDSCPHNFNGNCYIPSNEISSIPTTVTFEKARQICQDNSATLASIHSKAEVNFIRSIFKSSSSISQVAIGGYAEFPDTFNWIDGSKWDFDYRNPMYLPSKESCLQMTFTSSSFGQWKDVSCTYLTNFLCKRPAGGVSRPVENVLPSIQLDLNDFSNCNTTFLLIPGTISSVGYPNYTSIPPFSCTWKLVTVGAYRVGVYVTDAQTENWITFSDGNGKTILTTRSSYQVIAPGNIVNVQFSSGGNDRGFKAYFLPV